MPRQLIDKALAAEVFDAAASALGPVDSRWVTNIERLSAACENAPKTHIAFIGTALLAKAVSNRVDARVLKVREGSEGAYSARTLAKDVLVPRSIAAGVDLGVTGREPLNNQPYFQISRVDEHAPIHGNAREAFQIVLELLDEIDTFQSEAAAAAALQAFIQVRRRFARSYPAMAGGVAALGPRALAAAVTQFVQEQSEGGKRAQAVVAGMLDTMYSRDRVESGRINDPSRHYPGDVVVWAIDGSGAIEKAFEVRDKPVSLGDALIFLSKAAAGGAREAAIVACHPSQQALSEEDIVALSQRCLVDLAIFYGWTEFVIQVLMWSPASDWAAAGAAYRYIWNRLMEIEVAVSSLGRWHSLVEEASRTVAG